MSPPAPDWGAGSVGPGGAITHRTYARAGLFGNPSDQYGGRTIAFSLENFYAEVTLTPAADGDTSVRIQPHPVYDSTEYGSLGELVTRTSTQGLYGGVRLLLAAVKRFAEHCAAHGIPLRSPAGGAAGGSGCGDGDAAQQQPGAGLDPASMDAGPDSGQTVSGLRGFTLSYDTTVPRQTGLSGSSAIIYSAIKCLAQWYGVPASSLPPAARPGLVLSVEAEELGVAAGLQDRVIQVYGGFVHMDFGPGGCYSRLDPGCLPVGRMYLMFSDNPSESGKVHSGVKAKWLAGDPQVRALMSQVMECGVEGLRLLLGPPDEGAGSGARTGASADAAVTGGAADGPVAAGGGRPVREERLAQLMNRNADLRRALFGDAVLGRSNIRMLELARSVGAGANFSGSGGAVVVLCPGGQAQAEALRAAAEAEGFTLLPVRLGPELEHLPPASLPRT
ncbi:hypothetical protein GPECTOR_26g610 [Gonium pectorale]|uniref:GHMP kinase N-terminal domain-containing protein n=1 Tax=Gonium pectorale TaxID=33097 RepID=A0A150GFS6_GONPE|nr:hypothetical protein GPECTOR_26g610 [Gonium pectorale]|eukprot:KXZ48707.1 hypothetical protein GPECTOR_26g610 [Gonium pectorale]